MPRRARKLVVLGLLLLATLALLAPACRCERPRPGPTHTPVLNLRGDGPVPGGQAGASAGDSGAAGRRDGG